MRECQLTLTDRQKTLDTRKPTAKSGGSHFSNGLQIFLENKILIAKIRSGILLRDVVVQYLILSQKYLFL